MKQEQLLDDTRESEMVDWTVLFLLAMSTIVSLYLSKIAVFTVNGTPIYNGNIYSYLLNFLGFAVGAFLYNFFRRSKWVVITGFLMIMIFCVWETLVLAAGNYFDNWLQVCLLELGSGMIIYPLVFIFLNGSRPFCRKQTYYILFIYLTPVASLLLDLGGGYFILPETTGFFPIVICFILMILGLFLFLKRSAFSFYEELAHKQVSPKLFIIIFGVILTICITVCVYALLCNIPAEMDAALFFHQSDLINLAGGIFLALLAIVTLLKWGALPFNKMLKTGTIVFCIFLFTYLILFLYNKHLHTNHFIFQILIELIFVSGSIITISFLSYLVSFSSNRNYDLILTVYVIPGILTYSFMTAFGFLKFMKLLQGNIFYIIMSLTALSSILFLLYLNRTNTPVPDDDRTDRLQP